MPEFGDHLSTTQRLELAVRVHGPARLAERFSAYAGQFYDRSAFDLLAREVSALYSARCDVDDAYRFRVRLDRRLRDRWHLPVDWDGEGDAMAPQR
jgi:hypothetical protein